MDNPNLLNCLVLARNTLSLSSTLHLFIYLPTYLIVTSPSSSLYISLLLYPSLFIFPLVLPPYFSLSPFLPPSLSYPPSLFIPLPSPLPLPLILFPHCISPIFLFSLLETFFLNPTLHDISYSCISLSLSILYSHCIVSLFLHTSPLPHPLYAFLLHT